jgi:hypothetical protein
MAALRRARAMLCMLASMPVAVRRRKRPAADRCGDVPTAVRPATTYVSLLPFPSSADARGAAALPRAARWSPSRSVRSPATANQATISQVNHLWPVKTGIKRACRPLWSSIKFLPKSGLARICPHSVWLGRLRNSFRWRSAGSRCRSGLTCRRRSVFRRFNGAGHRVLLGGPVRTAFLRCRTRCR